MENKTEKIQTSGLWARLTKGYSRRKKNSCWRIYRIPFNRWGWCYF